MTYYIYKFIDTDGKTKSREFYPGECIADYEIEHAVKTIKSILADRGEEYVEGSIQKVQKEDTVGSVYYDACESFVKALSD